MKLLKFAEVSAIPHAGFDGYCRAGRRWTTAPTQVEVVRLSGDEKPGPHQITEAQFAALDADDRIKVRVLATDERPKPSPSTEKKPDDKSGA